MCKTLGTAVQTVEEAQVMRFRYAVVQHEASMEFAIF